jgi:hypothetical protein
MMWLFSIKTDGSRKARLTCRLSIIEIVVDNNSITEIDLSGLVNLDRVDCANNSGIIESRFSIIESRFNSSIIESQEI